MKRTIDIVGKMAQEIVQCVGDLRFTGKEREFETVIYCVNKLRLKIYIIIDVC